MASFVGSLIIDESSFADVSSNGSPCSLDKANTPPWDVRSLDPKLKIISVKSSKRPGPFAEARPRGATPVGGENVSPSPRIASVALRKLSQRKPSGIDVEPRKFSDDSGCIITDQPSPTYPEQKHGTDLNAGADQDQYYRKSTFLSVANPDTKEGKLPATEADENIMKDVSDGESLPGPCSIADYSSNSAASIVISKSPIVNASTAPQHSIATGASLWSTKLREPQQLVPSEMRQDLGDQFEPSPDEVKRLKVPQQKAAGHRKTSSGLSSVLLSVFNTVASAGSSSSSKSGHQTHRPSRSRWSKLSNRSDTLSDAPNHVSPENDRGFASASHKATIDRALQRRRILGELISSETGYISDLRILAHVYLAMLGTTQLVDKHQLRKAQVCVATMISVHDDLLAELKRITRDCSSPADGRRTLPRLAKHVRFESVESSRTISKRQKPSKLLGLAGESKETSRVAEPNEAADIAKLFSKTLSGTSEPQMGKFLIYEEYGAMYAEVLDASALVSRSMPDWVVFERGIEALVHHVLQPGSTPRADKKGLTLEDLLIKPLQRICRYPLLFADLQSHCPAIDDPEAHSMITKTLERLREIAHEVNNATNDLEARARLRRTQQLATILRFPYSYRPSFSLTRDLGHAKLCGVLFVAYQSRRGNVEGGFMLCALFNSYLLLASAEPGFKRFTIEVILGLDTVKLETANNGIGLQCHETPYTWKIVFHAEETLYEFVLCACTDLEQQHWKSELESSSARQVHRTDRNDSGPSPKPDFFHFDMKPLVDERRLEDPTSDENAINTFRKPTPTTRAMRITIRNTHVPLKTDMIGNQNSAFATHDRSHNHVSEAFPTLAPDKNFRVRMEQALSGVWTREILSFPAMSASRSGQILRASTSIMRRLSKASITSSPSKRSASQRSHASTVGSYHDLGMEDPFVETAKIKGAEANEQEATTGTMLGLQRGLDANVSRKISFSDALTRPKMQTTEDEGSETNTIIGARNVPDGDVKPKKSKSLLKVSKERLQAWLV